MNQKILETDIPVNCTKCPYVEYEEEGWLCCSIHDYDVAFAFTKPEFCPLDQHP